MATQKVTIGVDVGGTSTKGALVDSAGATLARVERPTDIHAGTKGVITTVEDLLHRAVDLEASVQAIGVGAAGFVHAGDGAITFSPNLTFDDPQLGDALRLRFNLPVAVDNDANAAAWGERTFGSARGLSHVALITIGTGIGSGIIVDGRLIRGATGAGGEFGHTVLDPDGPACPCGLRGCLEQFSSGTAIERTATAAVGEDPSSTILAFAGDEAIKAEHVVKAAREYDETAREILRRAGTMLGIGLSNLVNVFDPEVIVLGGGVIAAGEPFLGPARDELSRRMTAQRRRAMRLDVTTLGNDAGILGAAALAFDLIA